MSQAVTHELDQPVRAFIEAKLSHDNVISDIRDSLYQWTGASQSYRKSDPHLTILPPFTIDKNRANHVDELLDESGLVERPVPITGVGVWPSIENPRVVLLTIPDDFESKRQELTQQLREIGAINMEEPVCPHITLFKTDNGYDVEPHVKRAIRQAIWDNRKKWTTEIKYVDFTILSDW